MKLPIPRHLESVPAPAATGDLDEQLLAIFFDQMPMGIAVFDADRRLQRCSRSWAGFFVTYLGVDADYVRPGALIEELIPGNDDALRPLVEGVLAGNVIRQQAHRLEKDGVVAYWDVVFAPVFADGKVVGFVDVVTDATERRLAYEALETRVSVLARLASAMTVDRPLPVTVRAATTAAVEATGAVAAECVVTPPAGEAVTATTGTTGTADDGTGRETQQIVLPVATAAHTFGRLVAHYPLGYDAEDERATLQAIADLAAAAIENARLFGEAEAHAATLEKQRLARDLHDSVSQALFSMTLRARTAQRLLAQLEPGTAGDAAARLSEQLEELSALTGGALAEMRALIFELRPDALAAEGLVAALTRAGAGHVRARGRSDHGHRPAVASRARGGRRGAPVPDRAGSSPQLRQARSRRGAHCRGPHGPRPPAPRIGRRTSSRAGAARA